MTRDMEQAPSIIFEDDAMIVMHKPSGWFAHPTSLDRTVPSLWEWLKDHYHLQAFGVHRLDRATSGLLVFAKSSTTAHHLCEQFRLHQVEKTYEAIVRGFAPEVGEVASPVVDIETGKSYPAHSHFRRIETYTHKVPFGRYEESRFSHVELMPLTGRKHQLRRHLVHIRHPIIGDSTYGDNKLNRHMCAELGWNRLLLFATRLRLFHPLTGEKLQFQASSGFKFPV